MTERKSKEEIKKVSKRSHLRVRQAVMIEREREFDERESTSFSVIRVI